jgi:23S rRNA G2445 N2-methylase RlmL
LALKSLKVADDIDILLDYTIGEPLKYAQIFKIIKTISQIREINGTFSFTISQRESKYNLADLQADLVSEITQKGKLKYNGDTHTDLDFRLFVERESLSLSVRIFKMPLSHRAYKTNALPGSLKPSVAAAMVYLLTKGESKSQKIIDLYCGSGTILAESLEFGFDIFGSDIDAQAVEITKTNLNNFKDKNLNKKLDDKIRVYDAVHTKWNVGQFDTWISNFPWDKQVKVAYVTELYKKTMEEVIRISKPQNQICCLVHKPEIFMKLAKKYFPNHQFKVIEIGYLGQNPSLIYSV